MAPHRFDSSLLQRSAADLDAFASGLDVEVVAVADADHGRLTLTTRPRT